VYEYTGDTKASTSVAGAVGGAAVGWMIGGRSEQWREEDWATSLDIWQVDRLRRRW